MTVETGGKWQEHAAAEAALLALGDEDGKVPLDSLKDPHARERLMLGLQPVHAPTKVRWL